MWYRILIGGVVGGVVVFFMGFVSHGILGLQGRTLRNLPDEPAFVDAIKSQGLKPGLYAIPGMPPKDADSKEKARLLEEMNAKYKAGPAGMLLIAPTGQDTMSGETLFKEFVTNLIAALLASFVISLFAPDVGFFRRWVAVFVIGIIGWFSYVASYGIWYRFPHDFIHDEFLCGALEWGVAGAAIGAIVRRKPAAANAVTPT